MTNHFAVNDVCCVALELSKSTWVWAFASPEIGRASVHKMRACDADRLLRILETGRARAMREVSRSLEIVLCYEVGYDGFWLARCSWPGASARSYLTRRVFSNRAEVGSPRQIGLTPRR